MFAPKKDHLWVGEDQEYRGRTGGVEDSDSSSSLEDDDDLSFLSLSEKPDRNMALLDDYEAEELDFDSQSDHRSGLFVCLFVF